MKLQNMTIIFLIIVIPLMVVLSVYFAGEVKTIRLQIQYNEALKSATSDAIKAFEDNSMNNDLLSQNAEPKRENIKASINMFIKSLAASNGLAAYNENDINDFIPAMVFGLYDGFYMYTPTINEKKEYENMLKNYVYYSEKIGDDIIIRYSLDNYVAVSGTINGEYITKAGYLSSSNHNITPDEETLQEYIIYEYSKDEMTEDGIKEETIYEYYLIPCIYKYNNKTKIYKYVGNGLKKLDISESEIKWVDLNDTTIPNDIIYKDKWYTYSNYKILETAIPQDDKDDSAKKYFNDTRDFTNWWNANIGSKLQQLKIDQNNDPEDDNSEFSKHKNSIIKNTIQSNLNTAISAYTNRQTIVNNKPKMPILSDDDWEKVYSNVSVITFLQGIDIGFTKYNNYCVQNSTFHTEYPNPNSLNFIEGKNDYDETGAYHDIRHVSKNLTGYKANEFVGIRIITQDGNIEGTNHWVYYSKHYALSCYECINDAYVINKSIYDYISNSETDNDTKKAYWTALARERYNTSKSTDNFND